MKNIRFILVDEIEELAKICLDIKTKGYVALDTETTSFHPLQGMLVGISLCIEEGTAYYVPINHVTGEKQIERERSLQLIKEVLEDVSIKKYLHHAKFDALVLYHAGIELKGIAFDTMIAASLLVGDGQRIGLKALSEYYFQEPMFAFNDIVKNHKYKNFSEVPLALATGYAAADAHQTRRLVSIFEKALKEQGLDDLFFDLEMRLLHVLIAMEKTGVILDTNVLIDIDRVVSAEIHSIHTQIIDLIGHEFADINLNSPKQLGQLLFEHLQLPVMKKTTGKTAYSTDQEVLEALAKVHPVPALIIRYRELSKLKSTYLDALGEYVNKQTGRVHTTYNQTAVATGRLASSEPNLQNIPVDSYAVRSAFKAAEGSVFLSADYSQIELRVLAYVSQDPTLLQAFKEGKDIHAITAAGLFEIDPVAVTSEQRQLGKRINFSILYGLTAHGLSKDLDISHSVARSYIDKFMAQYPGVVAWMNEVIEKTKEKGYVETLGGRRRYLPGIYERNRTLYDLAKRVAINTVAQGTAAELMKKGMINLDVAFKKAALPVPMILQIHDELLIEVPEERLVHTQEIVRDVLSSVVDWNVPLEVTTRSGKTWQDVTK